MVQWGFIFAERPDLEAPDARIISHLDIDPATLRVAVIPLDRPSPDHFRSRLACSQALARGGYRVLLRKDGRSSAGPSRE